MKAERKNILVISHEASLTGAPVLLLNLLQLLKNGYSITIILKRGGILTEKFQKIARTVVLKSEDYSQEKSFLNKLLDRSKYFFKQISLIPLFLKTDFVFSNTICNGRLLNRFRHFNKPVLTYVHELESMLLYFNQKNDTNYSLLQSSVLLYPSVAVLENLKNNHQIPVEKLKFLPYYFPGNEFEFTKEEKEIARKTFCTKWNIKEEYFLIVGMGVVSERKGTNKFIEIANEVIKHNNKVCFVWIGNFDETEYGREIFKNWKEDKYHERIFFTGRLNYAPSNLLPFDLFFLSSVEDPYPLVVLEAAYQKVPAICYKNAGGISEFLDDGAGYILNEDDLVSTVQFILKLLHNTADLSNKALVANKKVKNLHSNETGILRIINNLMTQ
jgi:glycosyltransferase involved in cell wall biosynthesis